MFWIAFAFVILGYVIVDLLLLIPQRFVTLENHTKIELYSAWYRGLLVIIYLNILAAFEW